MSSEEQWECRLWEPYMNTIKWRSISACKELGRTWIIWWSAGHSMRQAHDTAILGIKQAASPATESHHSTRQICNSDAYCWVYQTANYESNLQRQRSILEAIFERKSCACFPLVLRLHIFQSFVPGLALPYPALPTARAFDACIASIPCHFPLQHWYSVHQQSTYRGEGQARQPARRVAGR